MKPEKIRGQHFLIEDSFVKRMVAAAGIGAGDTVVEVGPGWGMLTEKLVAVAGRVIAIEIEKKMVEYLEKTFRDDERFVIWHGDVQEFWKNMPVEPYAVVANIPYSITSLIIRGFLEKTLRPPEQMVLMIQKEVAGRITAQPGDMTMLALSVQWYGTPKKLFNVPKGAFWPSPEVDSAVIHIKHISRPDPAETKAVFALANKAFGTKRKQLGTSLVGTALGNTKEAVAAALRDAGIAPTARPEELSVADWRRLWITHLT